jgi:hypothetical protein
VGTQDAVAREAAWLSVANDTLPPLLAANGGPFKVLQAYWPGAKFAAAQTGVYVQRRRLAVPRFGGQRLMPHHSFLLKVVWPVKTATAGMAETEQQHLDDAVELLRQRINGLPGDHTHGGRFLSAGETPPGTFPAVEFADPEVTIPAGGWLRAVVTYDADDREIQG